MPSIDIKLIIFIIKTGICTLLFVIGIYCLIVSREKWENLLGTVLGIPDLEVSPGAIIFLKVLGLISLALGFGMFYLLFL